MGLLSLKELLLVDVAARGVAGAKPVQAAAGDQLGVMVAARAVVARMDAAPMTIVHEDDSSAHAFHSCQFGSE